MAFPYFSLTIAPAAAAPTIIDAVCCRFFDDCRWQLNPLSIKYVNKHTFMYRVWIVVEMCKLIQTCAAISVSYLLSKEIQQIAHTKNKNKSSNNKNSKLFFDYCWTRLGSCEQQWARTRTHQRPISIVALINFLTHERWCDLSFLLFISPLSLSLSLSLCVSISTRCFCSRVCSSLNEIYTEKTRWQKECC